MKIIRSDQCFIHINIWGLTIDIPKVGSDQRYQKNWFFGMLNIPFSYKVLMFNLYKNFTFKFSIFNPLKQK